MSGVQILTVTADETDQRVDRWLRRKFPHLAQGRIEKMCRTGDLRVDGAKVKSNTRVTEGQQVKVPPLPEEGQVSSNPKPRIASDDAAYIQQFVIYRDDDIIALNKPAGLPTQGGSKLGDRHVDGLSEALIFDAMERPRLVHRLDKDTSGILILARNRLTAAKLSETFKERETRKIYWAAVAGTPNPRMGTIRYGLVKGARGSGGEGEKMHCIHPREVESTPGAKRATTDYSVLSALGGRLSWVALVPVTGRTHQLRAHMAEHGHPILGDGKYGGSSQENMGDGWGAGTGGDLSKKLHLHARTLIITHPVSGARLTLTAPLPDHMKRTWDLLDWRASDVLTDPFLDELT